MKDKIIASLIHLGLSFVLISTTAGLMVWYFYPGIFREIKDIYDLLKILVPVDIILGPLLTFILYKKGKRGLTFDLAAIALCQMIALSYGCWTLYNTRPGFLIFSYDSFYIAPPSIDQKPLMSGKKQALMVGKLGQPKVINSVLDIPLADLLALSKKSMSESTPLQFNSRFFQPFDTIDSTMLAKRSIKVNKLMTNTIDDDSLAKLKRLQQSGRHLAYIPVIYDNKIKTIAVDLDTKTPVTAFDINPY